MIESAIKLGLIALTAVNWVLVIVTVIRDADGWFKMACATVPGTLDG